MAWRLVVTTRGRDDLEDVTTSIFSFVQRRPGIKFIQPQVAAGARVSGAVAWTALGKTAGAHLLLAWRTEGSELADFCVVREARHEFGTDGPTEVPFDFGVPGEGPLSYDGKLFRIIWEIAVLADIPWLPDEIEHAPFRVVARRQGA